MEERILTLHPKGKQGVHISKARYELVHKTILAIIKDYGEITLTELLMACEHQLVGQLEGGSISWYTTTVKLDLEARGEIEQVPGSRPQKLKPGSERTTRPARKIKPSR